MKKTIDSDILKRVKWGDDVKRWKRLIRAAALLGQLGFALITPPVLLALGAWKLQEQFGFGTWIMLAAILVGLLTGGSTAYRLIRDAMKDGEEDEKQEQAVNYYGHD